MMNVNQRVQVPRFGNWEAETTVPYTVCFDKAVRGRASGEMIKPSSQNPEKVCSDSSPARTGLYSGEVKSDDLQPSWEVPAFGDWDGQGVDAQYTVYFEKVRKRGSLGHATNETNPHNRNTAEDALPTTRNVPFGGKSPQHQKGKNSGIIMQEEAKQGSTNRVHESSAAKFGHKKMNVRQSPNSKHVIDGSTARVPYHNGFSEGKPSSPSNFGISGESRSKAKACQNEVVVPGTVLRTSSSGDESNPPQVSSKNRNNALQSSAGSNSSYNKSPKNFKEPKVNACCFPWCRK